MLRARQRGDDADGTAADDYDAGFLHDDCNSKAFIQYHKITDDEKVTSSHYNLAAVRVVKAAEVPDISMGLVSHETTASLRMAGMGLTAHHVKRSAEDHRPA
jgi:hypothetical protein